MDIKEYNGTSLAYMGDAVMSLLVREMLLAQGVHFSVKRNMQSSCADAIPIPQARQKMRM